jgi:hypothetical protein
MVSRFRDVGMSGVSPCDRMEIMSVMILAGLERDVVAVAQCGDLTVEDVAVGTTVDAAAFWEGRGFMRVRVR